MPKCKCGEKMERDILIFDVFGNEMFKCKHCGITMKKVPFGNPKKKTYIFWVLLSVFFTKKIWFEPKGEENPTETGS